MARRRFTEEELDRIANKEWKVKPIFTSDERLINRAKNLTGPRTVEGKKRALMNLRVGANKGEKGRVRHGGYIMGILDEDEQEMYKELRESYEKDYDINSSADEAILELVLIDQIRLYRVMRAQFEKPSMDIDRPLTEISNRLNKNLDSLGALRKQRMQQDDKVQSVSIATIAQQFARELMSGDIQDQLEAQKEEERQFLEEKKRREREERTVDVEYEVVDEEEGDKDVRKDE